MLDPYYASAHYFLGQLDTPEGKPGTGHDEFHTNLVVAPENRYQMHTSVY